MTLSDLASIGSLVSGVAVLVSLIYLAQQTQQNSRHTRALIQQGRAVPNSAYTFQWAADASLTEAVMKTEDSDPTLDRVQFFRYFYTSMSVFAFFEDLFYQHREGLIDDQRHAGMVRLVQTRLQSAGFRACWKIAHDFYGTNFQAFMNESMASATAPPADSFESWKALVAADQSGVRA